MSESVILEEDIDENYEPTAEEIEEYANFLQMDLPEDSDLLWIAKEGLKAPLPEPWKPCKTRDDEIYYFNFESGESTWEHPCDEYYRKQYQTHKAQKAKKQVETKKKRQPDPTLPFDLVDSSAKKSPGQFRSLDDSRERDPVLKFEMEKKLRREKQEMEEKYSAEAAQLARDFEDKRNACKRAFDRDLEALRRQDTARREDAALEAQRWFDSEAEKARANARKEVESEEQTEKDRIQTEHRHQLQLLAEDFARKLSQEQEKIRAQQKQERDSLLQSEESVKLAEIRRLTAEIEQTQARIVAAKAATQAQNSQSAADIAAAETLAEREIAETTSKLRAENNQRLAAERKTAEERYQREVERIKAQSGDEARRNLASFQTREAEIRADFAIRLQRAETEVELAFGSEQAKLDFDFAARLKQLADIESTRLKASMTQELETYRLQVQRELAQDKLNKEKQVSQLRKDNQKQLGQTLEAEKARVQEELRRGRSGEQREEQLRQAVLEAQRAVEIADKEQSKLTEMMEELRRGQREEEGVHPEQLERLEREMESLRTLLQRKEPAVSPIPQVDETSSMRISLQQDKQELKEQQRALELDRERWRLEVRQYEADPGSRSRLELQNVKKALDAKARKLNERVEELRAIEKWIQQHEGEKSLDFEIEDEVSEQKLTDGKESLFDLSEDLASGDRVKAPAGYAHATEGTMMNRLQTYDRQLANYGSAKDQARARLTKVDAWLSAAKEELRYSTPSRDFLR